MTPFKRLDVARTMSMLEVVSMVMQAEKDRTISYRLHILTHQGSGITMSYRAQLIPLPDNDVNGTVDVQPKVKFVWLYRRIAEGTGGEYVEHWHGFG